MRTHFVLLSFCTICVTVTCFEITLLAEKDDNKNELQRLRPSNTLTYPGVDTKEDDGDFIDEMDLANPPKLQFYAVIQDPLCVYCDELPSYTAWYRCRAIYCAR
uniref:Uncharacterized protein n=1 Tax=Magallana gigas TaxID=29159 RepID=A0A8W8KV56_MAGGI|nr:uncharacterized protein LOC105331340 [Crassostrea gigas]